MNNKRYVSYNSYLRSVFGEKVFKVSLDGGFTCPNRDGTSGFSGCIFCSSKGSGDFSGERIDPISVQFAKVKKRMHKKWKSGKVIAYFQSFSNTYAPVSVLQKKFESALLEKEVVGLAVATRPDCLPDDVVSYLGELNKRTFLWVELGLQTIHDESAKLINRGHDFACFCQGVKKLRKQNINVCVHIINGLPFETRAMMMETAQTVSQLDVQGIKIHLLHLLKNTKLMNLYETGNLTMMEKEEYVSLVCDQLEVLPENMVIQRLTGDGPPDLLVAPLWSLKKWEVLNAIDAELVRRNSWQGRLFRRS